MLGKLSNYIIKFTNLLNFIFTLHLVIETSEFNLGKLYPEKKNYIKISKFSMNE